MTRADLDDNCDGLTDDASPTGQSTWYLDADGDSFGSASTTVACAGAGLVATSTDCDDTSATVNPAATETCNDLDDDCDGLTDDASATGQSSWYLDADGDTFGGARLAVACDQHAIKLSAQPSIGSSGKSRDDG